MRERLEGSYQGSSVKGRRCSRIENCKGLCPDERRVISQNAKRNPVKMRWAQRGPEETRKNAQHNLWVLQRSQFVP